MRKPAGGILSFLASLTCASAVPAQSTDLIDMRSLGERGATIVMAGWSPLRGLAGLGDFDGDGFSDVGLLAAEVLADTADYRVTVIFGRAGLTGVHTVSLVEEFPGSLTLRGRDAISYLHELVGCGDVDGDGKADILLGAATSDTTTLRWAGYLLFGQEGLGGSHDVEEIGDTLRGIVFTCSDPFYQSFALSIASIGDWNGDGGWDIAVGAPQSDAGGRADAGSVFILFGGSQLGGVVDLAAIGRGLPGMVIHGVEERRTTNGTLSGAWLGTFIRPAGDFNGDGLDDVLLGAPGLNPRRAFLVLGRRDAPPALDLASPESRVGVIEFSSRPIFEVGSQLGSVGDLNGDGFGDILLGHATRGDGSRGFIVYGRSDFPETFLDLQQIPPGIATAILSFNPSGDRELEFFGRSVAGVGDVNGDGVPDMLLGASDAHRDGLLGVGEAYLVHGRRDFGAELPLRNGFDGIRMVGEDFADAFGTFLDGAGDFNGDGSPDLLAGGHGRMEDDSRAYIIYGSGSSDPPFLVHEALPTFGSIRGGTEVTIRGSGFIGAAAVTFGADAATSVRVVSPTEIHAVTPPRTSPERVDVTVVVGGVTRTLSGAFEYTPRFPEIDLDDLGTHGLVLDVDGRTDVVDYARSVDFLDWNGDGVDDLALASEIAQRVDDPDLAVVTVVQGRAGIGGSRRLLEPGDGNVIVTGPEGATIAFARRLGDVNGDGIADLGLGRGHGRGYVLFGRRSPGSELSLAEELASGRAVELHMPVDAPLSLTLAPAGDLTGDGVDEFFVGWEGPSFAVQPQSGAGEVVLIEGREDWPESFVLDDPLYVISTLIGASSAQGFGKDIKDVGDVNGDGHGDVLVKAANPEGNLVPDDYQLRAYILFLSGDVPLPPEGNIDQFIQDGGGVAIGLKSHPVAETYSMGGIGDVDGDGLSDFAFAVPLGGEVGSGVAFLVRGRTDFPQVFLIEETPSAPDGVVRIFGARSYAEVVGGLPAGDWNLDGYPDFALGSAPDSRSEPQLPGNVFVVFGGPTLPERIDLAHLGGRGLSFPGRNIAYLAPLSPHVGDLNGDGAADLAVREDPNIDLEPPYEERLGKVYVLFGPRPTWTFVRGDANADGTVNIADPIFILGYLFLGGEAPACDDAADSDDGGRIEITDAVRILNHLFLGTAAIPAPYPAEGDDPTVDSLGCLGF